MRKKSIIGEERRGEERRGKERRGEGRGGEGEEGRERVEATYHSRSMAN